MNKVINLISGPRNLSTALMYSFTQREDCDVLDEPFYGSYLKQATDAVEHPIREEILRTMELKVQKVVESINSLAGLKMLFVKGMAHHFLSETPSFLLEWDNVILIRHPRKLIASFSRVVDNPGLNDIGIKKASELFLFLKEHNKTPVVIDSDELVKDPGRYLKKLCDLLNIPFTEAMLKWEKGGIPEDGIWAQHWYAGVHASEGFITGKESNNKVPSHLETLVEEALPYYNILRKYILIND
jgi:hypothetical protein